MSTKKYFNIEFSKCIGKGGSKKCYNITKLEPVSKRDVYNVTQIGLSIEDSEKIITELENGKPLVEPVSVASAADLGAGRTELDLLGRGVHLTPATDGET